MTYRVRRVDYFHTTVRDRPGEAYRLLARLSGSDVNLLAFSTVPLGPDSAQLTLFPDRIEHLARVAEQEGLILDGPHPALLVRGDDRLGALAEVHAKLCDASINVFASSGVASGGGRYGYVVYVRGEDIAAAVAALGA